MDNQGAEPVEILLKEIRLKHFKAAFKPQPIPLAPFNVVVGRNGSGKSTLIEALQWLDKAIRRDAREACDRYFGISDLINLRSSAETPSFEIQLDWVDREGNAAAKYLIKVEDNEGLPRVASEHLTVWEGTQSREVIETKQGVRTIGFGLAKVRVLDPDRLALALVSDTQLEDPIVSAIADFWRRAVFLRLSPNRLAQGSSAVRRSFDSILDEEGHQLPALLFEFSDAERAELAADLRTILPNIQNVKVVESGESKDKRANYSLLERMPYRGRSGRYNLPIPAWMLSEGTRRITALVALMRRTPRPSILCVEEIENGLDPWTTREVVERLEELGHGGGQVILTTHSPWLLDHVSLDSILLVRRLVGDTQYEHFADLPEVSSFDPSLPAGVIYSNLELPIDGTT